MQDDRRLRDRHIKIAALIALVWAIGLLLYLSITSDGVVRAAAFIGTIIGGLLGGLGAYYQNRPVPPISRAVVVAAVGALLVVDGLSTLGGLVWHVYQANRSIDVTARVTLDRNIDVLPGGHARLDVDIVASRAAIVIVFRVTDHNRAIGSCMPNTRLAVTPDTAGNRGSTTTAVPGEPVTLRLPSGARRLSLDITVVNVRNDVNCAVDVAVSSAKLTRG